MSQLSDPGHGAVFLSPAREDAAAARRLAAALRAAGITVWCDQDERREGSAWDASLSVRIDTCTLFVPVLSAHTNAQPDTYVRKEWRLAAERTRRMPAGRAFVVPVVVDDLALEAALAPVEFQGAPWTRLPGGAATPEFLETVRGLLDMARLERHARDSRPIRPPPPTAAAPGPSWLAWIGAISGVAALALAGMIWWRLAARTDAPPASAAPALPRDKSIAVLPFQSIGGEADQESRTFAAGLHADVVANLQNIRELRVVSRTSVLAYRSDVPPSVAARELGVAYVLTGTAQRQGARVRVSAQLVDARANAQVWTLPAADHDVANLFALQSDIAAQIAAALATVLSPQERQLVARAPTASIAAYDLYHEARAAGSGNNLDGFVAAERLLERAVELDPNYAAAWGQLALYLLRHDDQRRDLTGTRRAQAQRAADLAERLAPDRPETLVMLAAFYHRLLDARRAEGYARRAAEAMPTSGEAALQLGEVAKRQGRYADALEHIRRAQLLDRRSPEIRYFAQDWLLRVRRFAEAAELERADPYSDGYQAARLPFYASGSTQELVEWERSHPEIDWQCQLQWRWFTGDAAGYVRACDQVRIAGRTLAFNDETKRAFALMALGRDAEARAAAANYVAYARRGRELTSRLMSLNLALAGETAEARTALKNYLRIAREQGQNLDLNSEPTGKAVTLAWIGDKAAAIAEVARLLREPSGVNVHELRRCAWWLPLRGVPEFEQLLADPANNAPLF